MLQQATNETDTMSVPTMQSIRAMNNDALSAFSKGRTQQAHETIRRAMQDAKRLNEFGLGHRQPPLEATPMTMSSSRVTVKAFALEIETTLLPHRSSFVTDMSFLSMYQNAFVVVGQDAANTEDLELVCIVLLYNWAFMYHCKRICRRTSNLENALRLYRMSIHLFRDYLGKPTTVFTSDLQRLLCALLSNMAHIHSHRFDQGKMQDCIAQLRRVLQIPMSEVGFDYDDDDGDDFDWFQLNSSSFSNNIRTAPAA